MSSLTSIAQTGLQAAQVRMGAAAHNVANAQTPDFRRQTVSAQATQPGANLSQDMVDQLAARQAFVANLGVLKTSSDTLGSLLSVRA